MSALSMPRLLVMDVPPSEAVSPGQDLDRVLEGLDSGRFTPLGLDPLQDVLAGQRAFRDHIGRAVLLGLAGDRLADLHRHLEPFLADAPGPAMARAALDRLNLGPGD